jgi:hypothetical protein
MGVHREIDGREWNVAKQACRGTLVQTYDAKLPDDVDRTLWYMPLQFSCFTLHLESDFPVKRQTDVTTA